MPGEASLPIQYYPDDFGDLNINFPLASAIPDPCAVFFAEDRASVIDSVILYTVSNTQSGATIALRVSTNPTNTTANPVCTLDIGTANNSRLYVSTDRNPFTVSSTGVVGTSATSTRINSNENTIPAGSYLILDPSTTVTWRGFIQIRMRTRQK